MTLIIGQPQPPHVGRWGRETGRGRSLRHGLTVLLGFRYRSTVCAVGAQFGNRLSLSDHNEGMPVFDLFEVAAQAGPQLFGSN